MTTKVLAFVSEGIAKLADTNPPRYDRSNKATVAASFVTVNRHLRNGFKVSEKEAQRLLDAKEKRQLELFAKAGD